MGLIKNCSLTTSCLGGSRNAAETGRGLAWMWCKNCQWIGDYLYEIWRLSKFTIHPPIYHSKSVFEKLLSARRQLITKTQFLLIQAEPSPPLLPPRPSLRSTILCHFLAMSDRQRSHNHPMIMKMMMIIVVLLCPSTTKCHPSIPDLNPSTPLLPSVQRSPRGPGKKCAD